MQEFRANIMEEIRVMIHNSIRDALASLNIAANGAAAVQPQATTNLPPLQAFRCQYDFNGYKINAEIPTFNGSHDTESFLD